MKNIAFLIIFLISSLSENVPLSERNKQYIAKKITSIKLMEENLKDLDYHTHEDGIDDKKYVLNILQEYKDLDVPFENIYLDTLNKYNIWSERFSVYYLSLLGRRPTKSYLIAVSNYGFYYCLHGFGKNHFQSLIKQQIKTIDSLYEAKTIAWFYFKYVLWDDYQRLHFIDSSNYDSFKKKYNFLEQYSAMEDSLNYVIKFCTIGNDTKRILKHTIYIDKALNFKDSVDVLAEGKKVYYD